MPPFRSLIVYLAFCRLRRITVHRRLAYRMHIFLCHLIPVPLCTLRKRDGNLGIRAGLLINLSLMSFAILQTLKKCSVACVPTSSLRRYGVCSAKRSEAEEREAWCNGLLILRLSVGWRMGRNGKTNLNSEIWRSGGVRMILPAGPDEYVILQ
jgi:hypothetical protein